MFRSESMSDSTSTALGSTSVRRYLSNCLHACSFFAIKAAWAARRSGLMTGGMLQGAARLRIPMPFKLDQLDRLTIPKTLDNFSAKRDFGFHPRSFLSYLAESGISSHHARD